MRWAIVLLVIVAAGIGLWLWLGSGIGVAPPVPEGPDVRVDGESDRVGPSGFAHSSSGTGSLSGIVTRRARGVPATVSVRRVREDEPLPEEPPRLTARSGDDGAFLIEGLSTGTFEVRATARDGAWGAARIELEVPGVRRQLRIAIADGPLTLRIRACWQDGTPFSGHVVVNDRAIPADEAGAMQVSGLTRGLVNFQLVTRDGTLLPSREAWLPEESELDLVLGAGLGEFQATVVAAASGEPVAGAQIEAKATLPDYTSILVRARTDTEGRFTLLAPTRGGRLSIQAQGFAPWQGGFFTPLSGTTIRLLASSSVRGVVRAAGSGAPVPGVTVSAVRPGRETGGAPSSTSDQDGKYAIEDLSRGQYVLVARGGGYLSEELRRPEGAGADIRAIRIEAGEMLSRDVTVRAAAAVSGRVADADGQGVAGALVVARFDGPSLFPDFGRVATAVDGSFRIEAIPPDVAFTVHARSTSGLEAESPPLTVAAGSAVVVNLALPEERWVEVRVRELRSGEPIEGVRVRIHAQYSESESGGAGDPAWTGADGRARVGPVPDKPLSVSAWHPDCVKSVREDFDGLAVDLRLEKGLEIEGRVVHADGSPAAGATAFARAIPPARVGSWNRRKVGETGYFRLSGLSAGSFVIGAVSSPAFGQQLTGEATVSAGASGVEIRLEAGEAPDRSHLTPVMVLVLGPDGEPIADGVVALTSTRDRSMNSTTARTIGGRYLFQVTEGRLYVEVSGALDSRGARLGAVALGPLDAPDGKLTVHLPAERRIEGRVIGPDGAGVAGVRVRAAPEITTDSMVRQRGHAHTWSDPDGAFALVGLGDFEYRISLEVSHDWSPPEPMKLVPGTRDAVIRLAPAVRVVLTFLTDLGDPVAGATVLVGQRKEGGDYEYRPDREGPSGADGTIVVYGLPTKSDCRLEIIAPEDRRDLLPEQQQIDDWTPTDLTYRFHRARAIRGRVVDEKGRPVPGAIVWWWTDRGEWDWAATARAGGTFEIERAPVGELQLIVTGANGPQPSPSAVPIRVGADGQDLLLAFDPGPGLIVHIEDWPSERGGTAYLVRASDGLVAGKTFIHTDGAVRFTGLEPEETYGIWASCGERILHLVNLTPTEQEIRTRLTPAHSVSGQVLLPKGVTIGEARLTLSGPGFRDEQGYLSNGRFLFRTVPPGTWLLTVRVWYADRWHVAERMVSAGADIEIVLSK